MNDFKAGDKVRVNDTGYTDKAWIGVEGIVQGPGLFPNSGQYKVKLTDPKNTGRRVGYVANLGGKLELVEPPFTFKDIQKGDTIRRTEKWDNTGSVRVTEGVVTDLTIISALTAEGLTAGYWRDTTNPHMTLELLNRPEPVKEPYADAKVLTRKYNGEKAHDTFVKEEDGSWTIHYASGVGNFKVAASENLGDYLKDAEVKVLTTV